MPSAWIEGGQGRCSTDQVGARGTEGGSHRDITTHSGVNPGPTKGYVFSDVGFSRSESSELKTNSLPQVHLTPTFHSPVCLKPSPVSLLTSCILLLSSQSQNNPFKTKHVISTQNSQWPLMSHTVMAKVLTMVSKGLDGCAVLTVALMQRTYPSPRAFAPVAFCLEPISPKGPLDSVSYLSQVLLRVSSTG